MRVATTDPATTVRPLSRAEYDLLVDRGHLVNERVELIEGVLVQMPPMSDRHATAIVLLNGWLVRGLPAHLVVRPQLPFAASDSSEPEPDIAVADAGPSTGAHPTRLHLAVEVTVTTHHLDLVIKPRVYAAAGVPRYWAVDLAARQVVEHTDPIDGTYRTVVIHAADAVLSVEGVSISVRDLVG